LKTTLRRAFAVIAGLLLIWRVIATIGLFSRLEEKTTTKPIPYNDAVQQSIELFTGQATSWKQATLVLLGLLATLWIAKGGEIRLVLKKRYLPEHVMWVAGVALLCVSLYCNEGYMSGVAASLETGGVTSLKDNLMIADVFADKFDALRREQLKLLMYGATAAALALFSIRNLAGD
jgi:hypothetical protein